MARKKFTDEVRARKRDEILDAAMSVFEDAGDLDALSFRSLAAKLDLSYSAPYRYFSNKDELVNALRTRAFRWIEQEMLDAIKASTEPKTQLELLALAYIRSGLDRPHRYELMFFDLDKTDTAKNSLELKSAKRDALDVCTRVITAGQQRGVFPSGIDPLTACHLFWTGAHGLVSLEVAGQFVMGRDVQPLIPMMIQTLMVGMEHLHTAPVPKALINF